MAKSNYEELDAGGGLEIHNANEALQGKSLVRQLRRMRRPQEQERETLRPALQEVISRIKQYKML